MGILDEYVKSTGVEYIETEIKYLYPTGVEEK